MTSLLSSELFALIAMLDGAGNLKGHGLDGCRDQIGPRMIIKSCSSNENPTSSMIHYWIIRLFTNFAVQMAVPGTNPCHTPNKALVRRYVELWNTGNLALADEVLATDFVDHAHPEFTSGPESVKQAVIDFRTGFPERPPR